MTAEVDVGTVDRFRSVIVRRLGLHFDDAKSGYLAEVLHRRLEATKQVHDKYIERLEQDASSGEVGALARELTVPETYFFRNIDQFRAFAELALPDRMRARAPTKRLAILSAGCASGEEAYTLAILLRDAVPARSWDVSILGVDVNPAVLEKATRARFSAWALRETPEDIQRRWFQPDGRDFVLDEAVRASVGFERHNLVDEDSHFWRSGTYDIVFFRNVLMYFTPENAQAVVARVTSALRPGGYLFLGHAETLRGLSHDFHLRHTHDTFYYQRKDHVEGPPRLSSATVPSPTPAVKSLVAVVEGADTWVEAIRRATERIEVLTALPRPPPASGSGSPAAPEPPAWDLGRAREFLQRERFAEALDLVQGLPSASERDPDVLLLHAVLLTHSGQLEKAEDASRRLLQIDELNAGAHYLLALCREGLGDRQGAFNHDKAAVYVDPGFAMPRLHLGLLARRAGDRGTARKELGQALALLQQEDASRLLLFGGGFSREALIALARAELAVCGGKP